MRTGLTALLVAVALAAGCGDKSSAPGAATASPSGKAVDVCALANLPIATAVERAAALREAEAAWQGGSRFSEGVSVEQAKAATIFLVALQGDGRAPTKAEASAGFLPLPEARDRLRAACE